MKSNLKRYEGTQSRKQDDWQNAITLKTEISFTHSSLRFKQDLFLNPIDDLA